MTLLQWLLVLPLLGGCQASQVAGGDDSVIAASVPFRLDHGLVVVDGVFNDGGVAPVVIDTGFAFHVVDIDEARRFSVPLIDAGVGVRGFGQQVQRALAAPKLSISIGPIVLEDRSSMALSLGHVRSRLDSRIAGIVGAPLFRRHAVRIDYPNRTLEILRGGPPEVGAAGRAVALDIRGGLPHVAARIVFDGGEPIECDLLVDTGSNAGLSFRRPWIEKHGILTRIASLPAEEAAGIGGATRFVRARVSEVLLGDLVLRDVEASFHLERTGNANQGNTDGGIGAGLFLSRAVIFDHARSRMIVEPPAAPASGRSRRGR